jgi:hypothetical protein
MTWSAPSALAFSILSFEPTVVMTVQPMRRASWMAAEPMPEPPAWMRIVSPGSSLALSNSICSTVPKVTGATAAQWRRLRAVRESAGGPAN